jgi:hypothetical protein
MSISVFISHPTPHLQKQIAFVTCLSDCLNRNQLNPLTMGVNTYDMDAPLAGIRRLMVGCCGLISIAFRRAHVSQITYRRGSDIEGVEEKIVRDGWLTSPYIQIEPAMAFQLGLPILILKEKGVVAEGVLERGVTGLYSPEFELGDDNAAFAQIESSSLLAQWIGRVRAVYDSRGKPPALF